MKVISTAFILLLTCLGHAGFSIPKNVFTADQIEAATAEAIDKNKGLAFIYSDKTTNCGLCIAATEQAFDNLKSHSVLIYLDSKSNNNWNQASPLVSTGLFDAKMGNTIPTVVITSPAMDQIWIQMTYKDMKNDRVFRDTKKQVTAILKGESVPPQPKDRIIHWPTSSGTNFYIGSFIGVKNDNAVTLKMAKDGRIFDIAFSKLSPSCASYARTLAGKSSPAATETKAKPVIFETWTSTNGKAIKAKFIKLDEDILTLEMENGKTYTLPLDKLDATSQEKAKERSQSEPEA